MRLEGKRFVRTRYVQLFAQVRVRVGEMRRIVVP